MKAEKLENGVIFSEQKPLIELIGINKSFPGVKALSDINLTVYPGTVHVICGENGAGKSTLMKIINGNYRPDSGKILMKGKPVEVNNPIEARKHKISMIFQELNYIPENTIEEHLFLGIEPTKKMGNIDWGLIRESTLELFEKEGLAYSPQTKMKDLAVSEIQMIEILKAISHDAEVIIMDEPTSAITDKEITVLFKKIADLKAKGVGILYISHKLDEIFRIADEITVIRDGYHVDTHPASELNIDKVISMMVGRTMDHLFPEKPVKSKGECILKVDNFSGEKFQNVSFELAKGEILGVAGLMGAGRTEVVRALFGLDPYYEGSIEIHGKKVEIKNVHGSLAQGMVMVSEDRKRYGIIPMRSVTENVSLANLKQFIFNGYRHIKMENELVRKFCSRMQLKTPSYQNPVENLSGGNQQKVILAKWMMRQPDIMILDEPTRGIDVGTKYEIYTIINSLAEQGKAVLFISSELPELIGVCDRIMVMSAGKVTGVLMPEDFTQEKIMRYATNVDNIHYAA